MENFFSELKRRKVYRVAVAYAVVAWLVIQIATQTFPFLEVPNWTTRLVIILIALGFPVALILAWAFDLTSHGIKRTDDILPEAMPPSKIPEKSIAVLPFENLSDDQENAYFADGVQDDILSNLAKVADLKVISRTSVRQYRTGARNLREIGTALGVAHILEGTVRRAGNRVRINTQLINARTDAHVWAETFEREATDVFALQSELAEKIATALRANLSLAEKARMQVHPTEHRDAYDLYLRARFVSLERSGRPSGECGEGTSSSRSSHRARSSICASVQSRIAIYIGWLMNGLVVSSAAFLPTIADTNWEIVGP